MSLPRAGKKALPCVEVSVLGQQVDNHALTSLVIHNWPALAFPGMDMAKVNQSGLDFWPRGLRTGLLSVALMASLRGPVAFHLWLFEEPALSSL